MLYSNGTDNNTETYNNPFSIDELADAISKTHVTAVGPGDVHYQLLFKHLYRQMLKTPYCAF